MCGLSPVGLLARGPAVCICAGSTVATGTQAQRSLLFSPGRRRVLPPPWGWEDGELMSGAVLGECLISGGGGCAPGRPFPPLQPSEIQLLSLVSPRDTGTLFMCRNGEQPISSLFLV